MKKCFDCSGTEITINNVSQLCYNSELDRYQLDGKDLHCGDCLKVLIYNGATGNAEWVNTRLENGNDWYLTGLVGLEINGLFASAE